MAQEARSGGRVVKDLVYGIVGGALGTIVIERIGTLLYNAEGERRRKQEEELERRYGSEPSYEVMARRLAGALGVSLTSPARATAGRALHWAYGLAWGALYGLLHDRVPALSKAAGLPFGIEFALFGDEALSAVLKLTPPPQAFPWCVHARGVAGHVAYAATADAVYRGLRRAAG